MFSKKLLFSLVVALALVSCLTVVGLAAYPERPITIAVFSAAGGGTDLGNRAVAAAMEEYLGTKINVVNMPGASGGVAANFVWSKPHDGYYWGGFSEGILPVAVLGAYPTTTKDWEFFMVGGTPGVLSVRADSPFKTVDDVIKAMKENPGEIKLAASQAGCIWHIKSILLQKAADVDFKFMPYQGSNPSQIAALNGEVDVVLTGLGEQAPFLTSGKLRPLAMVELTEMVIPGVGRVPAITDFIPEMADYLPVDQFVGFALPTDTPEDILAKITDAFNKAMKSQTVKDYAITKYVKLTGLSGEEAKAKARKMEKLFSWALYDLGIAQKSPEEFGIPRP